MKQPTFKIQADESVGEKLSLNWNRKALLGHYGYLSAIIITLFVRFQQTIFCAKPISQLFIISNWDSIFYPIRVGKPFNIDPSMVQLHLPYRFFVAECWRYGIPLWNKFCGFGTPLLADPQAFVFSPLYAPFFVFPNLYVWNLILILELMVGAIATYFLCVELEFSSIAALVASLLFTFCPNIQFQTELLGNGQCLTPFVLLFFVRAGKKLSWKRAVTAGVVAAIDILSAHPEAVFVTISFASILMFFVYYSSDRNQFNLGDFLQKLGLAAVVCFGLAAPMLIPFAEYLANCHSGKFSGPAPAIFSWQTLATSILFPFEARGSLFFGPLAWWGISIALILALRSKANRFLLPLIICSLLSIIATIKFFPSSWPLLSMVIPFYFLPVYILFISMLSGFGVGFLFTKAKTVTRPVPFKPVQSKIISLSAVVVTLLLCFLPLPLASCSTSQLGLSGFQPFQCPSLKSGLWIFNSSCAIAILLIWMYTTNRDMRIKRWGAWLIVLIGIVNLVFFSEESLPVTAQFKYPKLLPISLDTKNGARTLPLGDHLFRSNTNLVYKVPMPKMHNPIFPSGFVEFSEASGAPGDCNQTYPPIISRLLDITGTRTILSEQPIVDEEILPIDLKRPSLVPEIYYSTKLTLSDIRLFRDTNLGAIVCHLIALPNNEHASYHMQLSILDDEGKVVSSFAKEPITGGQSIFLSGFIPDRLKHWQLIARMTNDADGSTIYPTITSFGVINPDHSVSILRSDQLSGLPILPNNRFKRIATCNGGYIAAYENQHAFSRSFFIRRIKWVKDRNIALQYMKDHPDELRDIAVMEENQKQVFQRVLSKIHRNVIGSNESQFDQSGSIREINDLNDSSESSAFYPRAYTTSKSLMSIATRLQVYSATGSLLVRSDLYYPGWKAYVDNSECPIFKADYLFRAVLVPAGKHLIRFSYEPFSFTLGLICFGITAVSLVCFSVMPLIRK